MRFERRLSLLVLTYLPILPASDNILCIGRVGNSRHAAEVTLLFEDVSLTLPLPYTQLTHLTTRQGYPVC